MLLGNAEPVTNDFTSLFNKYAKQGTCTCVFLLACTLLHLSLLLFANDSSVCEATRLTDTDMVSGSRKQGFVTSSLLICHDAKGEQCSYILVSSVFSLHYQIETSNAICCSIQRSLSCVSNLQMLLPEQVIINLNSFLPAQMC